MITIDDRLKSSSVDELWAIKLFYETDSAITIERSSQDFVFFSSAFKLTIIDSKSGISDEFREFVTFRGRKYQIQVPNATSAQKTSVEGTYTASLSERGMIQFDNPAISGFTPFTTDKLVITPLNPYFPLSTAPYTDSGGEYYDPVITRVSSLNDSIDVIKSKAKTSNFSFSILNTSAKKISGNYSNTTSDDYLRYLASSDKNYRGITCVNRICEVYSIASGQTSPTKIYHGRVSKISYSKGQIKVSVNSEKPFSNRTIPSNMDVDTNSLGTLAYGNYENNTGLLSGRKLFPAPFAFSTNRWDRNFFKLPDNLVSYSNVIPHFYDKTNRKYLPLYKKGSVHYAQNGSAYPPTLEFQNEVQANDYNYYVVTDPYFYKKVIIKANFGSNDLSPQADTYLSQWKSGDSTFGDTDGEQFTDSKIEHIWDQPDKKLGDTGYQNTSASAQDLVQYVIFGSSGTPHHIILNDRVVAGLKLSLGHDHKVVPKSLTGVSGQDVKFDVVLDKMGYFGALYHDPPLDDNSAFAFNSHTSTELVIHDGDIAYSGSSLANIKITLANSSNFSMTPVSVSNYMHVNTFNDLSDPRLACRLKASSFGGNASQHGKYNTFMFNYNVYDLIVEFFTYIDADSDAGDKERDIKNIEEVYIGVDGVKKAWDASNPCITPNDIHRDLLHRECGITSTPDGWADLETARSSFNARYWVLEETDLEGVLDKLQEEGAFIFRYNALGNPSYLYVKNSYSSSDVKATIGRNHISSISSSITPFKDLITKVKFKYDKDPASDSYTNEQEFTKNESRERYGLSDKEDIMDKSLDIVVDSQGVTALSDYYFNIASQTKSLVDVVVVDSFMLGLEIGDIIKFEEATLDEEIIGSADNQLRNKYYMIIKLNRSLGKGLKIQAREVYQS